MNIKPQAKLRRVSRSCARARMPRTSLQWTLVSNKRISAFDRQATARRPGRVKPPVARPSCNLDTQTANCAFHLRMPAQLYRSKILRSTVDQPRLCTAPSVDATVSSKPINATQRCTIRMYCQIDRCGSRCNRLGQRKSTAFRPRTSIHASKLSRVCSVISNWTGRWCICCRPMALTATWLP